MTKLEQLIFNHPQWRALGKETSRSEKQAVLDNITEVTLAQLNIDEVCQHVQTVYEATVEEYGANPHTKDVVDELMEFMSLIPDGGLVVDVGCGVGRDALFMACDDSQMRAGLMQRETAGEKTIDKYDIPNHKLTVLAIDNSPAMVETTNRKITLANKPTKLVAAVAYQGNMHVLADTISGLSDVKTGYDGVWSCTALFTHTPRPLCQPAIEQVSRVLRQGGIFFTSYTNGKAGGHYNKLLMSGTGRIKYFSQPLPEDIVRLAEGTGLRLLKEDFSDFVVNGKVLKENLFVSQFFEKID